MTPWTDADIATLRRLWKDGIIASAIALAFRGRFSRSAILGKVHRLGLSPRTRFGRIPPRRDSQPRQKRPTLPVTSSRPQVVVPEPRPAAPEPPVTVVAAIPEPIEAVGTVPVTIAQLRFPISQCRCVMGDPAGPDTLYCGLQTVPGSSYCGYHDRIFHVGRGTAQAKGAAA